MNKFTNPLNNIKIASPCKADWNEMIGNERQRFCGECKLNVYNLSGMTRGEAESLLIQSEGRLCVRFFKRGDGTVLTKDCPVGWQAVKKRISKTATAFVSLIFGLLSGLGLNAYFNQNEMENVMGTMTFESIEDTTIEPTTGMLLPPSKNEDEKFEVMGKVAVSPDYPVSGGISNIDDVRGQVRKKHRR